MFEAMEEKEMEQNELLRPEEEIIIDGLIELDGVKLFTALRRTKNIHVRRELTSFIYEKKLSQWRQNENFDTSVARHLVDDVHSSFRKNFARVISTSPTPTIDVRLFNSINSSLHSHHRTQDEYWFPRLNRLHPEISGISL
jgi:deoxyribodipyrimidine photolyase